MLKILSLAFLTMVFGVFVIDATYSTADPEIDFYIHNPKLIRKYLDCVEKRSTSTCGIIARRISRLIPEALFNQCRACTPDEAAKAHKIIQFVRTYYPYDFNLIWRMYYPGAPSGQY
uniref:Chemosensory protein 10 n=1 Tax=Encarsia formosa TaxID=32400 RepID=A0A6M5CK70_ENCFO|nr:chemosensory protein 10 [Encarsia formosa]